jgi:hypothetical protein
MVVRLNTAQIIESLKARFAELLSPDRTSLLVLQEELILSGGEPFRRVWVRYDDAATWNTHGTCGQEVHVWLSASGQIAEIFVEPLVCPI